MAGVGAALQVVWSAIQTVVTFIGGSQIAQAFVAFAVSTALNAAFRPRAKGADPLDHSIRLSLKIDPTYPREIAVGVIEIGGTLNFAATRGTDKEYLERVVHLSDFLICGVSTWRGDGEDLTLDGDPAAGYAAVTNKYLAEDGSPRLWIRLYTGAFDATADAGLVANHAAIDSTYELNGMAYFVMRAKLDPNAFKREAVVTAVTRGSPLYDQRDETQDPDDPTTWSTDGRIELASLIVEQYLRGWRHAGKVMIGVGHNPARLTHATNAAAHDDCETPIDLAAGGTEPQYRAAGLVRSDRTHRANLQPFLDAMDGGYDDLTGEIRILPGVDRDPVAHLTDADFLRVGRIERDPDLDDADYANVFRGKFIDAAQGYIETDLPVRESESDLADDGGQAGTVEVDLQAVPSGTQGERILKRLQTRTRAEERISGVGRFHLADPDLYREGAVVLYTSAMFGYTAKRFRLEATPPLGPDFRPLVFLREDAVTSWSTDDESGSGGGNPGLNSDYVPAISGLVFAPVTVTSGAAKLPGVRATWTPPSSARVSAISFQYRLDGDDTAVTGVRVDNPASGTHLFYPLSPGQLYNFRPIVFSGLGAFRIGDWEDVTAPADLEPTGVGGVPASQIASAASDGIWTPGEKARIVPILAGLIAEQSGLEARATAYAITTEKTAYTSAMGALTTYLATLTGLTPPDVDWNDLSGSTPVSATEINTKVEAVYSARAALLREIERKAGLFADWGPNLNGFPTWAGDGRVPLALNADGDYLRTLALTSITGRGLLAGLDNITLSYVTDAGGLAALDNITLSLVTDAGGLAALNSVAWDTHLTGRPSWSTDGRVPAALDASGNYLGEIALTNVTGRGALAGLDDITLSLVTDAGALAGLDNITLAYVSDAGDLAGLDLVPWGTHISGRPANVAALTGSESINNALVTFAALPDKPTLGAMAAAEDVSDAEIADGFSLVITRSATRGSSADFTATSWTDIATLSLTDVPDRPRIFSGAAWAWPTVPHADSLSTVGDWQILEVQSGETDVPIAQGIGGISFVDDGLGGITYDETNPNALEAFSAAVGLRSGTVEYKLQARVTAGTTIKFDTASRLALKII